MRTASLVPEEARAGVKGRFRVQDWALGVALLWPLAFVIWLVERVWKDEFGRVVVIRIAVLSSPNTRTSNHV